MKCAERYLMQHFPSINNVENPKHESTGHVLNKLYCEVFTTGEVVLMELVGTDIQNTYFK